MLSGGYVIISVISALVPVAVIGAVIFFVLKSRTPKSAGTPNHTYYYLLSFISLAVLYWAVADLLRLVLGQAWGLDSYNYSGGQDDLLRGLAVRLSTILVALPIYAFHWFKATPPAGEPADAGGRKAYAMVVAVGTGIITLIAGTWLVYQGLIWGLGLDNSNMKSVLPTAVPYAALGLMLWVWHYRMWKRDVPPIR